LNIRQRVIELCKLHKTNNPFDICDHSGIKIKFCDLGSVRGVYFYALRSTNIYINCSLGDTEIKEVCAHELGHAILHRGVNTCFLDTHTCVVTSKYEIEADTFAAELLLPELVESEYSGYTYDELSKIFQVSERLIRYKVKQKDNQQQKGVFL